MRFSQVPHDTIYQIVSCPYQFTERVSTIVLYGPVRWFQMVSTLCKPAQMYFVDCQRKTSLYRVFIVLLCMGVMQTTLQHWVWPNDIGRGSELVKYNKTAEYVKDRPKTFRTIITLLCHSEPRSNYKISPLQSSYWTALKGAHLCTNSLA